jgi:hypothetical protein
MLLRHLRVLFFIPLDAMRLVTVDGLRAPILRDCDAAIAVSPAVQG